MRKAALAALAVGGVGLVLGIVTRLTGATLPIAPSGIKATSCLFFANSCFLASIALILLEMSQTRKS